MDTIKLISGLFSLGCFLNAESFIHAEKPKDKLNKAEMAGFLAGLKAEPTALVFAKYGLDDRARTTLVDMTHEWTCELARTEQWICKTSVLLALSRLAVDEVLGGCLCAGCRGTGLRGLKSCMACKGTGHKAMSGRRKAEYLGMSNTLWLKTWQQRYETVFNYVQDLDNTAQNHLHNCSG